MFSIRQTSDGWEVLDSTGTSVLSCGTYDEALGFIGGALTYAQAAGTLAAMGGGGDPTSDGLLPEAWMADQGICFSEPTGDGRDFTGCVWTWRDPNQSLVPVMLQTETEVGHFGAELAGFIGELHMVGTTPHASGRWYDNDTGRAARDLLLDGRRFGVSVDATNADVEFICTEEDEDGWCVDGMAVFHAYEIGGLTMTPFPAFARASIIQSPTAVMASVDSGGTTFTDGSTVVTVPGGHPRPAEAARAVARLVASSRIAFLDQVQDDSPAAVAASVGIDLDAPPRSWFESPEPQIGQDYEPLGSLGDEWLVEQGGGALAMPLHIGEDGRVLGHIAYWGQCHVGYPGTCVTPPESASGYAHFHVGETICADGTRIPSGQFVAGCDHALAQMRAPEARDHYAHNGVGWANVRVTNGVFGPFACGSLRSDVTRSQVTVLRAGAMSGDWRRLGGHLELIASLAVTAPGFPIAREAITASGLEIPSAPQISTYSSGGVQESLVASAIVRRCPDCQRRTIAEASSRMRDRGAGTPGPRPSLDLSDIRRSLAVLERRTRHLIPDAAAYEAGRILR